MLGLPQTQLAQQPQQQQQQQQQHQQHQQQQTQQTQQRQQQQSQAPTAQQSQQTADNKPSFLNFDASQLQIPSANSQQQTERVGLATVPENDFSKLNINGFKNFNDFRSVNAFAVTDLPTPELSTLLVDATADSYFSTVGAAQNDVFAPVPQSGAALDHLLAKLDRIASSSRA